MTEREALIAIENACHSMRSAISHTKRVNAIACVGPNGDALVAIWQRNLDALAQAYDVFAKTPDDDGELQDPPDSEPDAWSNGSPIFARDERASLESDGHE